MKTDPWIGFHSCCIVVVDEIVVVVAAVVVIVVGKLQHLDRFDLPLGRRCPRLRGR